MLLSLSVEQCGCETVRGERIEMLQPRQALRPARHCRHGQTSTLEVETPHQFIAQAVEGGGVSPHPSLET